MQSRRTWRRRQYLQFLVQNDLAGEFNSAFAINPIASSTVQKHPDHPWCFNNRSSWNVCATVVGRDVYVSVAMRHAGRVLKSEEARGKTYGKGKASSLGRRCNYKQQLLMDPPGNIPAVFAMPRVPTPCPDKTIKINCPSCYQSAITWKYSLSTCSPAVSFGEFLPDCLLRGNGGRQCRDPPHVLSLSAVLASFPHSYTCSESHEEPPVLFGTFGSIQFFARYFDSLKNLR